MRISGNRDLDVCLGGAFNCSKVYGAHMAEAGRGGVIVNIASDLGVIAPDQRLYRVAWSTRRIMQPVKPVTYSVGVKHGNHGPHKYLRHLLVRQGSSLQRSIARRSVHGAERVFVRRIGQRLIPMGRMAKPDEYRGAIAFFVRMFKLFEWIQFGN